VTKNIHQITEKEAEEIASLMSQGATLHAAIFQVTKRRRRATPLAWPRDSLLAVYAAIARRASDPEITPEFAMQIWVTNIGDGEGRRRLLANPSFELLQLENPELGELVRFVVAFNAEQGDDVGGEASGGAAVGAFWLTKDQIEGALLTARTTLGPATGTRVQAEAARLLQASPSTVFRMVVAYHIDMDALFSAIVKAEQRKSSVKRPADWKQQREAEAARLTKDVVIEALRKTGFNQSKAARLLESSSQEVSRLIRQYQISYAEAGLPEDPILRSNELRRLARESKTEEERAALSEKLAAASQKMWADRSEDDRAALSEKLAEATQRVWEGKSEKERAQFSQDAKRRWENMSKAERAEISENMSASALHRWKHMGEEELAAFREQRRQAARDRWANMGKKERAAFRTKMAAITTQRWKGMSEEEREALRDKISESMHHTSLPPISKERLVQVLDYAQGDFIRAAKILQIDPVDLRRLASKHKLAPQVDLEAMLAEIAAEEDEVGMISFPIDLTQATPRAAAAILQTADTVAEVDRLCAEPVFGLLCLENPQLTRLTDLVRRYLIHVRGRSQRRFPDAPFREMTALYAEFAAQSDVVAGRGKKRTVMGIVSRAKTTSKRR